jgi:hypothetical protein
MADKRSYFGGNFQCIIDGVSMGYIQSCTGGEAKANVVVHETADDILKSKHLGNVEFTPLSFKIALGSAGGVHEWIRASFDKGHVRKNGEVHACNASFESQAIREFRDGFITKLSFPESTSSSPTRPAPASRSPPIAAPRPRNGCAPTSN